MNVRQKIESRTDRVRDDFVPVEHYTSPEFLRLEGEHLWPHVWQVACREEELPKVGSFVNYDIMHDSVVVVRTSATEIKAFYNVCQHRGRRLTQGNGTISQFHCRFHGWQYDLNGKVTRVYQRQDWDGCPDFTDSDLSLKPLRVDTWSGWVFVNPDPAAPPLREFLDAAPSFLDPYEIQKMRYRWWVSVKVPCNWKVGVEAFNEAYHAAATHPQLMPTYGDDTTRTRAFGPHGNFYFPPNPDYPIGGPSPVTGQGKPKDFRQSLVDYYEEYDRTLHAFFAERDVEATRRLLTEVPADASPFEMALKVLDFHREAAVASGAGWPPVTIEQLMACGTDWHIFPNLVFLPYPTGVLSYRALPHPTDPNVCFFNVMALQRYAPGGEPPLERKYLHGDEDWRKFKDISLILQQDFDNMGEVQRGMQSRGFGGARTNPMQEGTVANFHRTILEYIERAVGA